MSSTRYHMPYIRHSDAARTIMGDVIIALAPLYFMAYFYYGSRVLLLAAAAILSCTVCDWLCSLILYRRINSRDLSPVVTGLILCALMPPTISFSVVVWASVFSIVICKAPFCGTGHNIFNPAAAGLAFATICWSGQMFSYTQPLQRLPIAIDNTVTLMQGPTATLKLGGIPRLELTELLLGNFAGPIASTFTLIIAASLLYLLARNVVKWYSVVSFVLPVAVLAAFNHPYGVSSLESITNELFVGSLWFVAVFMLSDPVTSPKYRLSRILYNLCAGIMVMLFRYFSPLELSAAFAVLLMNALAPVFDIACEQLIIRQKQKGGSAS